jgi:hypothetical protein
MKKDYPNVKVIFVAKRAKLMSQRRAENPEPVKISPKQEEFYGEIGSSRLLSQPYLTNSTRSS